MPTLALVIAVFVAALLQSLSGFGFALIVMPLATLVLGVQTAAPLVALAGLTLYTINLVRYRQAINPGELLRLCAASVVGIPVGIWLLYSVDEVIVMRILGLILVAYAAYAFLQPRTPRSLSQRWGYPAGFLAGCLGAAYNTPGPPVVMYGSGRQWPKDQFRAVLQALFFVNATLVVASHAIAQRLTIDVLTLYLYALPALTLGIVLGARVDQRMNPETFRLLLSVMILIMGLVLLFGVG